MIQQVVPAIGLVSFNCPTCGALAQQFWYKPFCKQYDKDEKPYITGPDILESIRAEKNFDQELKDRFVRFFEQRLLKTPFLHAEEKSLYLNLRLENIEISRCYSCDALAVWNFDRIIFPRAAIAIEPNADLDDEIKLDFREAAKIIDLSPRGAAGLLRLCVQKLCMQLGKPGKNIDTDIGSLVRDGLEPTVQRALDIVRVIGNEAVHPGQIDLRDDRDIAMKLFQLINIIADAMISRPKQIAELYSTLPPTKLEAIERRDGSKSEPASITEAKPPPNKSR